MTDVDATLNSEPITRLPSWLARAANFLLQWTDDYCIGGCGYPVTGRAEVHIDTVDGVPVVGQVCRLGGKCEERFLSNPTDGDGRRYSEIRPAIALHLAGMDEKPPQISLTFGRR